MCGTESQNKILLSLMKPVFAVFLLLWPRPGIFCRELITIFFIFNHKKIYSLNRDEPSWQTRLSKATLYISYHLDTETN